jgi:hypothetical protein
MDFASTSDPWRTISLDRMQPGGEYDMQHGAHEHFYLHAFSFLHPCMTRTINRKGHSSESVAGQGMEWTTSASAAMARRR